MSPASVVKFVGVVMVFPCLCDTPVTSRFWHTKSFLHQAIPFRQDLIQKTKEWKLYTHDLRPVLQNAAHTETVHTHEVDVRFYVQHIPLYPVCQKVS